MMAITSAIGRRRKRHDVAEHAHRLCGGPEQRTRVERGGDRSPVSEQENQRAADETGRDAAQEQHLERRKIGRSQLHEGVADDEKSGAGEHGGDAGEIGGLAHGAASGHKTEASSTGLVGAARDLRGRRHGIDAIGGRGLRGRSSSSIAAPRAPIWKSRTAAPTARSPIGGAGARPRPRDRTGGRRCGRAGRDRAAGARAE